MYNIGISYDFFSLHAERMTNRAIQVCSPIFFRYYRRQSESDDEMQRDDPISTCQLWVYVRMSGIMSLAWTSGFLAVFSQTYGLWLIFVVLNSFQGIFICVFFTLSAKTLAMYANKFAWLTPRRTRRYVDPPGDVADDDPRIVSIDFGL